MHNVPYFLRSLIDPFSLLVWSNIHKIIITKLSNTFQQISHSDNFLPKQLIYDCIYVKYTMLCLLQRTLH
jgi:hypothetical protein